IEFTPAGRREFRSLPDSVKDAAAHALAELAEDPSPPDAVELRGYPGSYRIKFYRDRYRILYRVSERHARPSSDACARATPRVSGGRSPTTSHLPKITTHATEPGPPKLWTSPNLAPRTWREPACTLNCVVIS